MYESYIITLGMILI